NSETHSQATQKERNARPGFAASQSGAALQEDLCELRKVHVKPAFIAFWSTAVKQTWSAPGLPPGPSQNLYEALLGQAVVTWFAVRGQELEARYAENLLRGCMPTELSAGASRRVCVDSIRTRVSTIYGSALSFLIFAPLRMRPLEVDAL